MPLEQLVTVVLLAGVVGLDVVSVIQGMVSRPIVAATLGGAVLGDAVAGLATGAALECLALESLPVGASRYPEWGSASVVAGAVSTHGAGEGMLPAPASFAVAVLVGTVGAWFAGWMVVKQRQRIAAFARPRLDRLAAGDRSTVVAIQLMGVSLDLARGTVAGLLVAVPAWALVAWVAPRWSLPEQVGRAVVITAVAAVAVAAVWKDFHAVSGTRRLFLLALALGTVAVFLGA